MSTTPLITAAAAVVPAQAGVGGLLLCFVRLADRIRGTPAYEVNEEELVNKASSHGSGDSSLFTSAVSHIKSSQARSDHHAFRNHTLIDWVISGRYYSTMSRSMRRI